MGSSPNPFCLLFGIECDNGRGVLYPVAPFLLLVFWKPPILEVPPSHTAYNPFHLPSDLSLAERTIRVLFSLDGSAYERTRPSSRQDQPGLDQWKFVWRLWKMLPENKMPFSRQDKHSMLKLQFFLLAILQLWSLSHKPGGD